MPIEIRELNIRMDISPSQENVNTSVAQEESQLAALKKALLAECAEQVATVNRNRFER